MRDCARRRRCRLPHPAHWGYRRRNYRARQVRCLLQACLRVTTRPMGRLQEIFKSPRIESAWVRRFSNIHEPVTRPMERVQEVVKLPWVGSSRVQGGLRKLTGSGRVGSGRIGMFSKYHGLVTRTAGLVPEFFKLPRTGSGRAKRCSKPHGSSQITLVQPDSTRPDPTHEDQ